MSGSFSTPRQISPRVGAPMIDGRNRGKIKISVARLVVLVGSCGTTALFGTSIVKAQDAEPRSYSNTPIGLNFLIAGARQIGFRSGPVGRRCQFPLQNRTAGLCPVVRFRRPVGQVRRDRAGVILRCLGASRWQSAAARDGGPGGSAIPCLAQSGWGTGYR
jgi:hypothetical protein